MASNPYLELQSDRNPYLEAAMSRETEARIIQKLAQLVPDSVSPELQSTAPSAVQSVYQSVFEGPVPSFGDLENGGSTRSDPAVYGQTPVSESGRNESVDDNSLVDDGSIALETGLGGGRDRNPYRSPEALLREEAAQLEQEQQQLRQETIRQQKLKQQREQQEAASQRQLKLRAKAFLKKIEALDPLEGERLWFESFAELCSSRLAAAMELVAIAPNDLE